MQVLAVIILALVAIIGFSALITIPVWLLWNGCLVGAVAGVSEISLLQAFGLSILLSICSSPSAASKL